MRAGMACAPPAQVTDDGLLRRRYLLDVGSLLFPPPARVDVSSARRVQRHRADADRDGRGEPGPEFLLLPSARRPRLLVPRSPRRAAAAAVLRYGEPRSRAAWLRSRALAGLLATPAGPLVFRDRVHVRSVPGHEDITDHLRTSLGHELLLSLHVGPPRANRKPVLQVLDASGRTLGFVKVGVDDLTRTLVRAETAALTRLAGVLRSVTVPTVLHAGRWAGLEVLVQSALPVWRRRLAADPSRRLAAMREVAGVDGVRRGPLASSGYRTRLAARIGRLPDRAGSALLLDALAGIEATGGAARLPFGAWHGDWTPWNCAASRETFLVWDWERFTPDVPLGYDVQHFALQQDLMGSADAKAAVHRSVADAPSALRPLGLEADEAQTVALLYLVEIATRYLTDRQGEAGARLGDVDAWLLPALAERVRCLPDATTRTRRT